MDSSSTPQTVAQAIEAATQQQQQLGQQSPPVQSVQSSAVDNLVCQWQNCGERCDSAETLYDHVCERHVGRKSTNNLNLTCAWGACRTTTVKRDHITSHIRVHVPLKPHKCDFCGKSFKRPQDLKKHVKTHADDSVLMHSPQPSHHSRSHGAGQPNGKNDATNLNIAEAIQAYMNAPRSTGYYSGGDGQINSNPYPSYQPTMGGTTADGNYGQQSTQYAGYGSVSYPNSTVADIQSLDTRRRAIEALNDFLGDIKRRALNPSNYYDVGQRLQSNALPLPIVTGNGYNMGYSHTTAGNGGNQTSQSNYSSGYGNGNFMDIFNQSGIGSNAGLHGPVSQPGYSLPVSNARTKGDLQDIDRFLEQLQATVYESSSSAAAAGVQQPGVHTQFTGGDFGFGNSHHNQYRSSHSPTTTQHSNQSGLGSNMTVSAPALDTPALTPASVSSYSSSGQSPLSSSGRPSLASNAMYPSLPSVTGISDIGSGYPTTTSAPASGLASTFDDLDGRRYSGGRLQRQAPASSEDTDMLDEAIQDDGSSTPRQGDAKEPKSKSDGEGEGDSSIDPALRGEEAESTTSEGEDKRQEEWVENIRVIEALRKWVGDRLKAGEYEETMTEEGDVNMDTAKDGEEEDAKAVETAKMVEQQMAVALSRANVEADNAAAAAAAAANNKQETDGDMVDYPSLPTA